MIWSLGCGPSTGGAGGLPPPFLPFAAAASRAASLARCSAAFSSRKLERATYDSVAFRFIAVNQHPDHDTIATFRRRFLKDIEALFVRVLELAREMGLLKLGTVALDGSALSYEHATKIEAQLKAEVAELLARAEAADQAEVVDGMSIPKELARREDRLAKLAQARAKIEARAKERFEREPGAVCCGGDRRVGPVGDGEELSGRRLGWLSSGLVVGTVGLRLCDRCSGSHSSSDGGSRNPVSRSNSRKLLIDGHPDGESIVPEYPASRIIR